MAAMGFSLNNLTLFGLVLAIGIVVDDAIVVVEAVEHHIEHGMDPRDATIRAMDEVSGPVIAIGLVLTAVFVPVRVHHRDRRPVLPPVRPDHRHLDGDLGVQLADPQPRPGRHPHQARSRGRSPRPCPGWPMPWPAPGWATYYLDPARWSAGCSGIGPCPDATADGRRGGRSGRVGAAGSIGWPIDRAPGLVLRRLQRRLRGGDPGLYLDRRPAAQGELRGPPDLRRPALPDLLRLRPDPDRVHPVAGQGLPAGQRPDARLDLGRADPAGDEAGRGDRARRRRASSTRWRSPASRSCSTPTPPTSGRCT